jgi:DnaK suppressor protein
MADDTEAAEEEALTDDDREAIRAKLEKRLEDARTQLDRLRGSSAPVSLDLSIGRLSRVDAMQQQQMASAARRRVEVEIRQITAALRRIQGTTYGECARCGGDIGRRRLLARPATPCCRHCEEEGVRGG